MIEKTDIPIIKIPNTIPNLFERLWLVKLTITDAYFLDTDTTIDEELYVPIKSIIPATTTFIVELDVRFKKLGDVEVIKKYPIKVTKSMIDGINNIFLYAFKIVGIDLPVLNPNRISYVIYADVNIGIKISVVAESKTKAVMLKQQLNITNNVL